MTPEPLPRPAPTADVPAPAPALSIQLFGTPLVLVHGVPAPRPRTRKGWLLVAMLSIHHDRPLDRPRVAGRLWPDSPRESSLVNLRQELLGLRQSLGPEAWRIQSVGYTALGFDATGAFVDVAQFDEALRSTAASSGDAAALERAVGLWRAPLLDDVDGEWIDQERTQRTDRYLGALERLAELATSRANPEAAAGYLERALAIDPLREQTARALMQALAACHRPGDAIEVYRELCTRMRDELGVSPSIETISVRERIRDESQRRASLHAQRAAG